MFHKTIHYTGISKYLRILKRLHVISVWQKKPYSCFLSFSKIMNSCQWCPVLPIYGTLKSYACMDKHHFITDKLYTWWFYNWKFLHLDTLLLDLDTCNTVKMCPIKQVSTLMPWFMDSLRWLTTPWKSFPNQQ